MKVLPEGAAKGIIKTLLCSVQDSSVFPLKNKQTKQKQQYNSQKKSVCFTKISQEVTMHNAPLTSRTEEVNGTNSALS